MGNDLRARFERLEAKGVLELLYVESNMPGRRWTFKVKGGASRTLTTAEANTYLDGLAAGWAAHDTTEEPSVVRQTACERCGLDIEGFTDEDPIDWRDRGNNTHCPTGEPHTPVDGGR